MAFGAGHVQDMNNRIKQNRAQRPSKRPKFKEHYRQGIFSTEKKSLRPSFKTVASKELSEEIRPSHIYTDIDCKWTNCGCAQHNCIKLDEL